MYGDQYLDRYKFLFSMADAKGSSFKSVFFGRVYGDGWAALSHPAEMSSPMEKIRSRMQNTEWAIFQLPEEEDDRKMIS